MTRTPDPDVAGLADRLHQLSVQQLALFEHLLDVLDDAAAMPATEMVCADALRTGDRIQGDRPDVVNTVACRPAYAAGRRHVTVTTRAGDGDLFTVQVPVDTAYRVRVPRPEPVWADDPFGVPNTLQHDPDRTMSRDEYELREAAYETSTEVAAPMNTTTIAFLDDDVEIVNATRYHHTVDVEVHDRDGGHLRLHFHEDLFALLAQAALDAAPYRDPGWTVPVDTACPDDPDGLHFVGCSCGEVVS